MLKNNDHKFLTLPKGHKKILLHSCCAPCSSAIMEIMMKSNIEYTIFFYNPNIHPLKEYELRKKENIKFAKKFKINFIDVDYDKNNWFKRTIGMEWEPERGKRCTTCFDIRFERTALYAYENNFSLITSSLGISRWKDIKQINQCGIHAVKKYPNLEYWTYNWRKYGISQRMFEISKIEKFYQQEYCGCIYSLRDTNKHRIYNGKQRIILGKKYYGNI